MCFPFYSVSRLIIRKYKPLLDELGITYPQYLVLLVLWENDCQPVNDIAKLLFLQTNTVTPLLQRLETLGIIERKKSKKDERKVLISLTKKGNELKIKASTIPFKLLNDVEIDTNEMIKLRDQLHHLIEVLQ